MPNFNVTLPDTVQAITRPVVFSIVDEIKRATHIPDDIYMIYTGDIGAAFQAGSTIDNKSRSPMLATQDKLIIDIKETFNEDSLGATQVSEIQQLPIFADDALDVFVKPVYATVDVDLTIRYEARSKTVIKKWRDGIRTRLSQTFDTLRHSVVYHYALPEEILSVLQAIFTAREKVSGYGDTFDQYIASHGVNRFTQIVTLTGKDALYAVAEQQGRILGLMDIQGVLEEPEKEEEGNLWAATISYKFSYQKPIGCDMGYPIMIHNQLLPETFVVPDQQDEQPTSSSMVIAGLEYFESDRQIFKYVEKHPIIRIPQWDNFIPTQLPTASLAVFYVLIQLTENSNFLLNLNELGDVTLNADLATYLQSEYPYLNKLYSTFLYLELYEDGMPLTGTYISIDSNLNVTATVPLDMRKTYRVRLSLITDLTLIQSTAFDRIKLFPKAFVAMAISINDALINFPGFMDLGEKPRITQYDFMSTFRFLTGVNFRGKGTAPNNRRMAPLSYLSDAAWERFQWQRVLPQRQMYSYILATRK